MSVNKEEFRKHQQSLSFTGKIRILEQLRDRELAIREAREELRTRREAEGNKK